MPSSLRTAPDCPAHLTLDAGPRAGEHASRPIWLIADVHLQPNAPDHPVSQVFANFLSQVAGEADLYILGDLFERWLGDDISLAEYEFAVEWLAQCVRKGTRIQLLYGNRDFLMRDAFWDATGIEPLPETVFTTLQGQPVLLMHGDELCTHDVAYQRIRQRLHQRWVQWLLLRMPAARRRKLGERLRQQSRKQTASKPAAWLDVAEETVLSWFHTQEAPVHIIHGHTHRPGHHCYPDNRHRWVLGDWSEKGAWVMRCTSKQMVLHFFQAEGDTQ